MRHHMLGSEASSEEKGLSEGLSSLFNETLLGQRNAPARWPGVAV